MPDVDTTKPITRGDIEAKLRQIQRGTDAGAEAAKGAGMVGGLAGTVLLVIAAYLLGRRRGRKRRTVVEIRRV
jgi:hypothetical protein